MGEMQQFVYDLEGAPDERTSEIGRALLERSVDSLVERVNELELVAVPENRTGVGADQAYQVLGKYRPQIRVIQTVLRQPLTR